MEGRWFRVTRNRPRRRPPNFGADRIGADVRGDDIKNELAKALTKP
jgi:hypothetical protein